MRDILPPLASLHAYVLVAETGSLTTAAERLSVTQPAISKRIRAVEAHLGTGLLHRGANSV
jgi:LysR family glycine cleavage system transcriptional activator